MLVGKTVTARPRTGFTVFLAFVAVGLIGISFLDESIHGAMFGVFPGLWCLIRVFFAPRSVRLTFDEESVMLDSGSRIPYASIQRVSMNGVPYSSIHKSPSSQLVIEHQRGILRLPPVLDVRFEDFYQFLNERMPDRDEIPASLVDFVADQRAKFGDDKVTVIFGGQTRFIKSSVLLPLAFALFGTGIIWSIVGSAASEHYEWGDAGGAMVGVAMVMVVVVYLTRVALSYRPVIWHACLVITPEGLAMVQGNVQGAIRWDDVEGVHQGAALLLQVTGAAISIAAIYDRQLPEIAKLVRANLPEGR
ncbi:MAG: hypothetical protein KDB14_19705 [Planctomycetales bacterium]|nr:hypothetical protein [Planctomycetales bacterium]